MHPRSLHLVWSQIRQLLPLLWFLLVLMASMVHTLVLHHQLHLFRSPSACGMPTVSRLPQSMISSVTASRSRWCSLPKPGCFLLLVFRPHGSSSICTALLLQVSIVVLWVSLPWSLLGVLFLWLNSR